MIKPMTGRLGFFSDTYVRHRMKMKMKFTRKQIHNRHVVIDGHDRVLGLEQGCRNLSVAEREEELVEGQLDHANEFVAVGGDMFVPHLHDHVVVPHSLQERRRHQQRCHLV